ncbi:MAG TPA: hypothetical protein VMX74_09540 [Pirellulales bacterium]|nr:hypothetical protein [Pirellulales bacterium]
MNISEQLNEAINRSISHTERVYLTVEADDISQAIAAIGGEWDIDHCRENDGSHDVWGSVPDSDSDSMAWRLCVTIG